MRIAKSRLCPTVIAFLFSAIFSSVTLGNDSAIRDISKIEVNEQQFLDAVASRTLTWLTGSSSENDHVSVGRLANFFGFVGLRVASGHSLTRSDIAMDTIAVLNDVQLNDLIAVLQNQSMLLKETHLARKNMNRALEGLLLGEELSVVSFLELGRNYGKHEAALGSVIAENFGEVARSLTPSQKKTLSQIRSAHISGNGHKIERQKLKLNISRDQKQELVNIAARFLSWTTGTQQYNDFEVVGKPSQHFGFVSLRKESNHGVKRGDIAKEVIQILSSQQLDQLRVAARNNVEVFSEFVRARAKLMRAYEVALLGEDIDTALVEELGNRIGELEARMTWAQAGAMLRVRETLVDAQSISLLNMRKKYVAKADVSLPYDPIERGRQLFSQCALCHSTSNERAVGPNIGAIVNRRIASDPTYDGYSTALREFAASGISWTEVNLDNFLMSPRSFVPGTYMSFDGLEQKADRAALIAYLKLHE